LVGPAPRFARFVHVDLAAIRHLPLCQIGHASPLADAQPHRLGSGFEVRPRRSRYRATNGQFRRPHGSSCALVSTNGRSVGEPSSPSWHLPAAPSEIRRPTCETFRRATMFETLRSA
jgi:hypothetical protein